MRALEIISLSYADDAQLYLQSDNLTSVNKLSFIDDINWRMSRNILELTETTQKYVLFVFLFMIPVSEIQVTNQKPWGFLDGDLSFEKCFMVTRSASVRKVGKFIS